ncbi:MAG TPA: CHASE domain-containing protein, partial [Gammaproteobacteria bacterium]
MLFTDIKPLRQHPLALGTGLFCCLLGIAEIGSRLMGYFEPVEMQFHTAFSFCCAGLGLILLTQERVRPAQACAFWLMGIGLLTLCEYALGINFGIANLGPDAYSGRMGFNTAICFFLSGITLYALGMRLHYTWRLLLIGLTCFVLILATSVLISHFSIFIRGARHPFTQMALHTSVGFIVLAGGLIGSMYVQLKTTHMQAPAAWPVLFVFLGLTLGTWHTVTGYIVAAAQNRFNVAVQEIQSAIDERMQDYEQILRGSRGLFAASERVSRSEWQNYVNALQLQERYPGIQGIGFAMRIPASGKTAHI